MRSLLACFALGLCLAQTSAAQTPAGISFAGTVVRVERVAEPALPRMRIVLRLTAPAIAAGQVVAFEEWDGLETRPGRYRVGQSVALTLYPTSALGLTSEAPARSRAAGRAPGERAHPRHHDLPSRPDRGRAPRVD